VKDVKVFRIDYFDADIDGFFEKQIKTKYVEGKTVKGAIGNLKNILYVDYLNVLSAVIAG